MKKNIFDWHNRAEVAKNRKMLETKAAAELNFF